MVQYRGRYGTRDFGRDSRRDVRYRGWYSTRDGTGDVRYGVWYSTGDARRDCRRDVQYRGRYSTGDFGRDSRRDLGTVEMLIYCGVGDRPTYNASHFSTTSRKAIGGKRRLATMKVL